MAASSSRVLYKFSKCKNETYGSAASKIGSNLLKFARTTDTAADATTEPNLSQVQIKFKYSASYALASSERPGIV